VILIITAVLLSYISGSFPTAILAGRIILKDDIRNHGSRNAGATNVFRVMGWKPALVVLLVDMAKGAAAVIFISSIAANTAVISPVNAKLLCGVAAIAGHVWTVFARFKGGKGVGTAFGVLVSMAPLPAAAALLVWLVIVLATRIVSLGSIFAGIALAGILFLQKYLLGADVPVQVLAVGCALALLILVTHRSNIRRLFAGTENKFGQKKKNGSHEN